MDSDVGSRILAAIAAGVTLAACSDRTLVSEGGGDESTGDTSAESDASATTSASTTGPVSTSSTGPSTSATSGTTGPVSTSDGDDGPKFDLGVTLDVWMWPPPPEGCEEVPPVPRHCGFWPDSHVVFQCLEVDGACPDAMDDTVFDALNLCAGDCEVTYTTCGPVEGATPCCYWGEMGGACPGRPFVVDGRERLASITDRDDWAEPIADPTDVLPPALRDALARAWTEDARFEHASVASFARFILHLLALGAPASLVAQAQQALADELAHARAFFGLASRYAARPIGPGPLDVAGALDRGDDPIAIVVAAVAEGCIAETISAMQIARARDGATDPIVHAQLDVIATEELAHAELAWRFVAWAHARGDAATQRAITATFADAPRHAPRGTGIACPPGEEPLWRAHGRLDDREREAIARETIERIVAPSAAALRSSAHPPSHATRRSGSGPTSIPHTDFNT